MNDPISVVAVVSANGGEWLVLNRKLSFVYEKVGNDYIGTDGPFRDLLSYERAGVMKAFAGRPMTLRMADGSDFIAQDHWWAHHIKGMTSVAYGDVESLRKCYVFSGGACIAPDDLATLRNAYTGCVYPYWGYEKVIKFDSQRKELWARIAKEEQRSKAILAQARSKHRELMALRAATTPAHPETQG
jgi:hypothetical protein